MIKTFYIYIKAFLALRIKKFVLKELTIAKSGFLAFAKADFLDLAKLLALAHILDLAKVFAFLVFNRFD